MVEIDSNAILVEPMKSRKDAEMVRAYKVMMARLKITGIVPKKHIMDNEVSENMKNISEMTARWSLIWYHQGARDAMQLKLPYETSRPTFSVY